MCSPVPARSRTRRAAFVAAAALLALSSGPADALAKGAVNPLTRHLASLEVGPGHEFRLLVVHPLYGPKLPPLPKDLELAAGAEPDTIGLRLPHPGKARKMRFENFVGGRKLIVPGQVVRGDDIDLAVTQHVLLSAGEHADLPASQASQIAPRDAPREERRLLPRLLPPTLRWEVMATGDSQPRQLRATIAEWAREIGFDAQIDAGRRSGADLGDAEQIKARVGEYRKALLGLTQAPPGLELVGYAVVLDGTPLAVESFGAGGYFGELWPGILAGMAVEASVAELKDGLLGEEMPPTGEPDRFLAPVRESILKLYGEKAAVSSARKTGRLYTLTPPKGLLKALVLDRELLVHALLVTDPRRRGTGDPEGFEPGVISRKARPTEAEKRWLERRKDRGPQPPNPPTPPPPPPVPPPDGG